MTTLKQHAQAYEPPQTGNIADLDKVSVDVDILEKTATGTDGTPFSYHYIVVDDIDYRVPNSVISSLKAILTKQPQLQYFAVAKDGKGMNTKYTVVPLSGTEESVL